MKKVLIVDDEFLIRFTLEEGLKDRGYETQSAETVKDALEKMKTFHPQVILLDNRLQDSLGIDEISTFRSADEEVQVILMTAYGSVAQAVEATKRGAYDYILKPFDIDEIDRIASRCIGQMQDPAPHRTSRKEFHGECSDPGRDRNGKRGCGVPDPCLQRSEGPPDGPHQLQRNSGTSDGERALWL